MVNRTNNRVLKLTVMIVLAIITVSCVTVTLGMHAIEGAEAQATGLQVGKLTKERYKYYEREASIRTGSTSWINERNQCNVVQIINRSVEPNIILEIYVNGKLVDLQKPLESITTELNHAFEEDVEDVVIAFCKEHQIDYHKDAIGTLAPDVFWDLISELQEETRIKS